jgi:outer membrane receptor for ferrienterochelin and colicin
VTVYGATSLENEYIIDGVNTTGIKLGNQGKSLNNEFVQEVEVKLGGYEAEYGRALGGVINVITKSGGNEFHGDLFGYFDNNSLASSDKRQTDRAAVGQAKVVVPDRVDAGIDVGGYFVKDALWFFGAYDRVNRDADWNHFSDRTQATTLSGTQEDRTNLYSGKLTWKLNESNTLVGSIFGDPGTTNSQPATLTTPGPDSAILQKNEPGATDGTARYNGIFGSRVVAEAQFGYHEEKNKLGAQDPAANAAFTHLRQQTGSITDYFPDSGFAGLTLDEKYKRYAYRAAGSFYLGSHE